MDGGFNFLKPIELGARGMTFNSSMLQHLLHGEFDVDPALAQQTASGASGTRPCGSKP
jgi:hypothetical protein